MSQHPIVHVELSAKDPKAAGKFYEALFGWKIDISEEMNYVSFETEQNRGGGFNDVNMEMTEVGDVIPYVSTDDIEASLIKAEELGGKTAVPKTEIPGIGWFAIFVDPTGNKIGLYSAVAEG